MLLLTCGLMSKPMLVTLPFLLLLIDWWPLGRFTPGRWNHSLVIEKLPLLAIAAAASVLTFVIQKSGGTQSDALPLFWRIGNGLTATVTYMWHMLWPASLAPFYPHPGFTLAVWKIAGAGGLLLAASTAATLLRRSHPYFFTGWFWYLGMLVPVLGIVQVGAQASADRYTYLPQIGLALCVVWAAAQLLPRLPYPRVLVGASASLVLSSLGVVTWAQAKHWRDSESLWTHTLAVTEKNAVAHLNLGTVLLKRGQIDEALTHYEEALRVHQSTSRSDLVLALIHTNIGSALRQRGHVDEAISHFRRAIPLQPDYAEAHLNLGRALLEKNEVDEATTVLQHAVTLQPEHPEMLVSLGDALLRAQRRAEAIVQYEKALTAAPQSLVALNNLAWLLATARDDAIRNGARAVELATRAVALSGGANPFYLHKLAAAYAETGNFAEASAVAEKAMQLAQAEGNRALAGELRRNVSLYRAQRPVRF
jgi:tetratricopeptide (TPR) repeat protein